MIDREKEYDEEIAPKLFELMKRSKELGMPIFAMVQFKDEDHGRTLDIPEGAHPILRYVNALAQCANGPGVNIDKFMFWVERGARKEGHSSVVLSLLKVPMQP